MQVIGKALGFDAAVAAPRAEAMGYDGVRVIDHFFSGIPPAPATAVPHAVATLGAAAALTSHVLLTQTVFAATMRHPFELAQAVATLDRISEGRAELGLGAGWLPDEHDANGLALGPPRERLDRLVEAVTIAAALLRNNGCVDFDGVHFRSHCAAPWPATPHIPDVMVGAHGHHTIRRVAPLVDRIDLLEAMRGGTPDFAGDHSNSLDQLARRIDIARGHTDRPLRFSATVNLRVLATEAEASVARDELAAVAGCRVGSIEAERLRLITTEARAVDHFAELAQLGIDRVHVRPMDEPTQRWLDGALGALHDLAPAT